MVVSNSSGPAALQLVVETNSTHALLTGYCVKPKVGFEPDTQRLN